MTLQSPAARTRSDRHVPGPLGERSRDRILDAAEGLLADRGFAGTSISAICKASQLPASSLYWYFENKADLAAAVVERASKRWLDAMRAAQPDEDAGAEELVAWVSKSVQEMGERLPFFIRLRLILILELGHRDEKILARLQKGRDDVRDLIQESLTRVYAAAGLPVESLPMEELAQLMLAFSDGAFMSRLFDPAAIDPKSLPEDLVVTMRALAMRRTGESQ